MKIQEIEIASIKVGKRMRDLDSEAVKSMADSIKQIGLKTPIQLTTTEDGYKLVAGRHRLAACKKLGWTAIPAIVEKGLTDDEIKLREIDENLMRLDLTASEEAEWMAERVRLWDAMNGVSQDAANESTGKGGKGQKKKKGMSVREVAKKTGKSKDAVARALSRSKLDKEVVAEVKGTKADKGKVLDKLVKVQKTSGKDAAKALAKKAAKGESITDAVEEQAGVINGHLSGIERALKVLKSKAVETGLAFELVGKLRKEIERI